MAKGIEKMEIITSNKGKRKVCADGYMYVFHAQCENFIRWRCSKGSSLKCKGILKTSLEITDPAIAKAHNHPADSEGVKVVKCMEKMKTTARNHGTRPAENFAEGVSALQNCTRARMPLEETVKRTLRNQRSKNYPKNPDTLNDLIIEGKDLLLVV